jgi:hypothetical protein
MFYQIPCKLQDSWKVFFIDNESLATKLHIFCFTIFSHQHPANRNNLDNHVNKCILLSYDDHVKGYHCYQPFKWHVVISHDVQIIEDAHVDLDKNFPIVCTNLIVSYSLIFPNFRSLTTQINCPAIVETSYHITIIIFVTSTWTFSFYVITCQHCTSTFK